MDYIRRKIIEQINGRYLPCEEDQSIEVSSLINAFKNLTLYMDNIVLLDTERTKKNLRLSKFHSCKEHCELGSILQGIRIQQGIECILSYQQN